ncbi:cyclic lactone autoinducer peptide [Paenibacillus polymyxa]|nr:cyclic lactone autoinducer peptide [Paenibacillus polymyxa]
MKKIMLLIGTVFSMLAIMAVSTASWTLIHNEPVPNELK